MMEILPFAKTSVKLEDIMLTIHLGNKSCKQTHTCASEQPHERNVTASDSNR